MSSNEENEPKVLLTPMEWLKILNPDTVITNSDGWRKGDYPRSFADPITESDFKRRLKGCIISHTQGSKAR